MMYRIDYNSFKIIGIEPDILCEIDDGEYLHLPIANFDDFIKCIDWEQIGLYVSKIKEYNLEEGLYE